MTDEVRTGSVIQDTVKIDGQNYDSYGIEVCSRDKRLEISDISADRCFVQRVLDAILCSAVSMHHVRDIVQDAVCERSLP